MDINSYLLLMGNIYRILAWSVGTFVIFRYLIKKIIFNLKELKVHMQIRKDMERWKELNDAGIMSDREYLNKLSNLDL